MMRSEEEVQAAIKLLESKYEEDDYFTDFPDYSNTRHAHDIVDALKWVLCQRIRR